MSQNKLRTVLEASTTVRSHGVLEAGLYAFLDGTFNEVVGKLHEKRHAQNFQAKLRHILSVCLYDSMRADQTRTP